MAELKTKKTTASVTAFLDSMDNEQRRKDAKALLKIFKEATGMKPAMWGESIVGFGSYHYKSDRSSQEGDWPLTGFSPRKANLTIYIMPGFQGYADLLKQVGKHTASVSCLYVKQLSDLHIPTLKTLIKKSVQEMRRRHAV